MLRNTLSSTHPAIAVPRKMFPKGEEDDHRLGKILGIMQEIQGRHQGIA